MGLVVVAQVLGATGQPPLPDVLADTAPQFVLKCPMQAAHRALLGIGDAFYAQVAVSQVTLDIRLEAILFEEAEVVVELLFILLVLQRIVQQPRDTVADQPGRLAVEQGVLVVSVADQVHQHAPQPVTAVQVHVAGLRQLPGGALE